MTFNQINQIIILLIILNIVCATPPQNGEKALDFSLNDLKTNTIHLRNLLKRGPVVLIVLRGWPGYQCPLCTRQVGELIESKNKFKKLNISVILIYPGPNEYLKIHASDFIESIDLPKNYHFLPDPDYKMINLYGLRWDTPKETAYPSTFVINQKWQIIFSKVSHTHSGRSSVKEILELFD